MFFMSVALTVLISIVFDYSEKMDSYYEAHLTVKQLLTEYYIHFIPFVLNHLSPLLVFITVIFFTSKMAANSEIIAYQASGVSYRRLMWPYVLASTFIVVMMFWMSSFVIPPSSGKVLDFKDKYVKKVMRKAPTNIQMEVEPGTILYVERFNSVSNIGYHASVEMYDGKTLKTRITGDRLYYDSINTWRISRYVRRDFDGMYETLQRGDTFLLSVSVEPFDLLSRGEHAPRMTTPQLKSFIGKQRARGAGNIRPFEVEYHKRFAGPIGIYVIVLLGVTLSTRKVRGGAGKNLGIGLTLAGVYIVFSSFSTAISVSGKMPVAFAVWLPNIIFFVIGCYLYTRARE